MKIHPIVSAVLTAYLIIMMIAAFAGVAVLPFIVWQIYGLGVELILACIPVGAVTFLAILAE